VRVVVVGAGAVGCATAFVLADRGVGVLIIDRSTAGSGASGAAAGMLAPFSESPQRGSVFEAGAEALAEFAAWRAAVEEAAGVELEVSAAGSLVVAGDTKQADELRSRLLWQAEVDPRNEWIDEAGLKTLAPHLRAGVLGALHYPMEMQVNAARYTQILANAAVARGACLKEGTPVRSLLTKGDRITGVQLDGLRVSADAVVLAPGADAELLQQAQLRLPLGPVKGELIRLRPTAQLPRFLLRAPGGYLAPTADGSVIVGATQLPGRNDLTVAAESASNLLNFSTALVPALREATFIGAWAGLRPTLPDHIPAVGPAPGYRGLWLAVGHHRDGILLAGWTGRRLASAMLDGDLLPDTMLPARFG
jgi:glycine oxidase